MAVYRAALVWLLRVSAVALLVSAVWNFFEMRQAVQAASAYSTAEAASLAEPALFIFAPATAAAALCLTLAEILSLLVRQVQR